MRNMNGEVPEDHKVRPSREIRVRWVKRPGEERQRLVPPAHTAYVFEVPPGVAGDDPSVAKLSARCDLPAHSRRRGGVEEWKFVNSRMVRCYVSGDPLRENEVGLLIPTSWRLEHPEAPMSAFFIDRRQFQEWKVP